MLNLKTKKKYLLSLTLVFASIGSEAYSSERTSSTNRKVDNKKNRARLLQTTKDTANTNRYERGDTNEKYYPTPESSSSDELKTNNYSTKATENKKGDYVY